MSTPAEIWFFRISFLKGLRCQRGGQKSSCRCRRFAAPRPTSEEIAQNIPLDFIQDLSLPCRRRRWHCSSLDGPWISADVTPDGQLQRRSP